MGGDGIGAGGRGLRLELSSEGRYALRALLYLAWLGERATADRISADTRIPRRLLARILAKLSRRGLVESEQGRSGDSRLARPADEISLRDAVEAAEARRRLRGGDNGRLAPARGLPRQPRQLPDPGNALPSNPPVRVAPPRVGYRKSKEAKR